MSGAFPAPSAALRRLAWIAITAAVVSACAGGIGRNIPIFDRSYERGEQGGFAGDGTYIVGRGDTVYGIARKVGVSTRSLIDNNSLRPPYVVVPGQRLRLPAGAGQASVYTVQNGDTVAAIARRFGVDTRAVIAANNLRAPYTIYVGQSLRLPGGGGGGGEAVQVAETRPSAAPVEAVSRDDSGGPAAGGTQASGGTQTASAPVSRMPITTAEPPPTSGSGFIWPLRGRVISTFGATPDGLHNDGLNIAAPAGAPIRAAENGVVAYAGSQIRGFGNMLLIKHEGGLITAYAHADELLVKRGETVTRGQVIARVGTSGGVEVPQLHFEVRKGTRAVDPSQFLPTG